MALPRKSTIITLAAMLTAGLMTNAVFAMHPGGLSKSLKVSKGVSGLSRSHHHESETAHEESHTVHRGR
jgi:hypothetical protein